MFGAFVDKTFLISTGRTGTKFMSSIVARLLDDFYSVHEPSPSFVSLGPQLYRNEITRSAAKRQLSRGRYRYLLKSALTKKKYFEANGNLALVSDLVYELYPESKFIFVVRKPEDWILSVLNRADLSKPWPHLKHNELYSNPYHFTNDDELFETLCWLWKVRNQKILKMSLTIENSILVKFEDLFSNEKCFLSVMNFISKDHGITTDYINQIQSERVNSNTEIKYDHSYFSDRRVQVLNKYTQSLSLELGYFEL